MADRTQPLLIGYFREIFFATATQRAAIRERLVGFAAQEGYTLELILCQDFDQGQSEFERLVELVKFHGASAVVISDRPISMVPSGSGSRSRLTRTYWLRRRHLDLTGSGAPAS